MSRGAISHKSAGSTLSVVLLLCSQALLLMATPEQGSLLWL